MIIAGMLIAGRRLFTQGVTGCGDRRSVTIVWGRGGWNRKIRTLVRLIFYVTLQYYILYNYNPNNITVYVYCTYGMAIWTADAHATRAELCVHPNNWSENPSIPWQPNFSCGFYHAHMHTHALFLDSTSKLESYDDVLFEPTRLDDDASPSVTTRNTYIESYLHRTVAVFTK